MLGLGIGGGLDAVGKHDLGDRLHGPEAWLEVPRAIALSNQKRRALVSIERVPHSDVVPGLFCTTIDLFRLEPNLSKLLLSLFG